MKNIPAKTRLKKRRRVLIVEDSAITRHTLNDLMAALPRLEIVGEAGDGRAALKAVRNLRPDIITLDIQMPGLNGLEVLKRIARADREIVVLTAMADGFYRKKCRELRVGHFFDKITEFKQFTDFLKTL